MGAQMLIETRDMDDIQTKNVPNACQQKYSNWQSAMDTYTTSYNNKEVIVYLKPNTRWWMELIPVCEPAALNGGTSTSSEEALWETFSDEDVEAWAALEESLQNMAVN
jgi:hypothetical protein